MKDNKPWEKLTTGCMLVAALSFASIATANTIDYASASGGEINFIGNSTFDFTPSSASFEITSGSAMGLYGEMTGLYTIGSITTVGLDSSASVTGSGLLEINDGTHTFTATLTWVDINQFGASGGLNTYATVNLTGISYNGDNAALLALADDESGIDVLSFQFAPMVALSSLKTSHHDTSFNGSIEGVSPPTPSIPDGGSTVTLMGAALLMVDRLRRKICR